MNRFFSLFSFFLLIAVTVIGQKQKKHSTASPFAARAEALLQECVDVNETVGITAGIYKDGKIAWQQGAGYADRAQKIAAKSNMVHRTASISKPMTAIAIMQLYEQEKLGLDDPIQQYLPYFPEKKEGTITIRHLLNHTSGIGAYTSVSEAYTTINYPTLKDAIDLFKDRDLLHSPGTAYRYTTYGYVMLGAIIESISKQSYRDYMKVNIWDKAGMQNTDIEVLGKGYANKSKLYRRYSTTGELKEDTQTDLSVKLPGGGIQSTVADLLKFGAAILENKLINAKTLEIMATDSGIKKRGNPYAMGWFLYSGNDRYPAGKILGHSGSQSGTSTQFMVYLDKKTVVAALANTSGIWQRVFMLVDKLSVIANNPETLSTPFQKAVSLSTKSLEKYTGSYEMEEGKNIRVSRRGARLFVTFPDTFSDELYPVGNDQFILRSLYLRFEFPHDQQKMILWRVDTKYEHPRVAGKKSMAESLFNKIDDKSLKAGLKWFGKVKDSEEYETKENELNLLGYTFLQAGKMEEAIAIFELNVAAFPNSWNAYDSLGEAYLANGNRKLAITNYEKSVKLNPESQSGISALKKLKSE